MDKLTVGLVIGWFLGVVTIALSGETYKDGQIDALNGKVKYELIEKSDKTKEWNYKTK